MKKVRILSALSAVSAAALVLASPALAVSVEVTGNGSGSNNTVNVSAQRTTKISQINNADITNTIKAAATTGNNTASKNTGGSTSITTGDATTKVNLTNSANTNQTNVACCDPLAMNVKLSDNGADSKNKVNFSFTNNKEITTENNLNINNNLNVGANTGDNKADKNTGGNTSIKTGDAKVAINIGNSGNNNAVVIGGVMVTNPPAPVVAAPIPGVPAVLGLTTKALPMTGYELPYNLILAITALLVGVGLVMKTKASEIEEVIGSFAARVKLS